MMMTKVLFFAQLRELLQCEQIELPLTEPTDIRSLTLLLISTRPAWQEHLQLTRLLCAVNQQLCSLDSLVNPGDEVALFPPVTGG